VEFDLARSAKASDLEKTLLTMGVKNTDESGVDCFETTAIAYQKTLEDAGQNDRILVFGSFLTVSAVLSLRRLQKH
jgi:dihydrofolate synthase/folylpolyglutamate synthase